MIFNVLNFVMIFISPLPDKKSFPEDHNNTELLTVSPCWDGFPKYELLFLFNLTSHWRLYFVTSFIFVPSHLRPVSTFVGLCATLPRSSWRVWLCNTSAHPPPFIDWSWEQFLLCSSSSDEQCNLKPVCVNRSQGEILALHKYFPNH